MDINSFRNAIPAPAKLPDSPDEKWPVKGYIIDTAKRQTDAAGDYILLGITGADGAHTYVLRPGDEPGLAFAEELFREVEQGLITIEEL